MAVQYVYTMNKQKQWVPQTENFVTVSLDWVDGGATRPTKLSYQKNYKKIALSDLKDIENVKIKDTFVRWQNNQTVYGVRFRTNEDGQKFVDALGIPEETAEEKDFKTVELKYGSELITHKASSSTKLLDILSMIADSKNTPVNQIAVKYQDRSGPLPIYGTIEDLKSFKLEITKIKDESSNTSPAITSERKKSNEQRNDVVKLNLNDQLWQVFLGVSNLSIEEVNIPPAASVIETFVQQHGGVHFLRQVNDLKMSPQLADELNTLAGQVHAIHLSPPSSATTTLERKKRRAPKPPDASAVVKPDNQPPPQGTLSKSNSSDQMKTFSKRKAPTPPSGKPPPQFVAPPPPMAPPPDEYAASPVGPLSPKSISVVCENHRREKNGADELLERKDLLEGLEKAFEEDRNSDIVETDTEANFVVDKVIQATHDIHSDMINENIKEDQASEREMHVNEPNEIDIDSVDGNMPLSSENQLVSTKDENNFETTELDTLDKHESHDSIDHEMDGIIENDVGMKVAPVVIGNIYEVDNKEEDNDEVVQPIVENEKEMKNENDMCTDIEDESIETTKNSAVEIEHENESCSMVNNVAIEIRTDDDKDVEVEIEKKMSEVKEHIEELEKEIESSEDNISVKNNTEQNIDTVNAKIERKIETRVVTRVKIERKEDVAEKKDIIEEARDENIRMIQDDKIENESRRIQTTSDVIVDTHQRFEKPLHNGTTVMSERNDEKKIVVKDGDAKSEVLNSAPTDQPSNHVDSRKTLPRQDSQTIKKPPSGLYAKLKARTSQMSKSKSSDSIGENTETVVNYSNDSSKSVSHDLNKANHVATTEVLANHKPRENHVTSTSEVSTNHKARENATSLNTPKHELINKNVHTTEPQGKLIQPPFPKPSSQPPIKSLENVNLLSSTSNHNTGIIQQTDTDQSNQWKRHTLPRAPPPIKPKPKPKRQTSFDTKRSVPMAAPQTFGRSVSETPGSRETVETKHVGSLTFGFAKDKTDNDVVDRTEFQHGVRPSQLFNASNMKRPSEQLAPMKEVLIPRDVVDFRATNL